MIANPTITQRFNQAADECIRRGEIGLQIAVYKDGDLVVDIARGVTVPGGSQPVTGETLFPIFSVTKAFLVTALHIAAEKGLLDYNDRIARHWPEFAVNGKDKATIRHILSHRLGMPQMPSGVTVETLLDYKWMISQLASMTPVFEPGTTNAYHSRSFGWFIAECIQRVDPLRRSFKEIVRQEVCDPLGIEDFWLGVPKEHDRRIATLANIPPTQVKRTELAASALQPLVQHTTYYAREDVRRTPMPGGAIANAKSVARLFSMLAAMGEVDGKRLLSADRVKTFSIPRPDTDKEDVALGYAARVGHAGYWLGGDGFLPVDWAHVVGPNPHTICHPGTGGSIGWADRDANIAVAICHNRMFASSETPFDPIRDAVVETFGTK